MQRSVVRLLSLSPLLLLLFCTAVVPVSQAAILKTLSGRVNRTDPAKEILIVDFTHPATGAVQAMAFRVTRETGLNGFHTLPEMKAKDIVTVDYEEQPDGISKALYVAKFRVSGPPTGMENFKGL
ncbi:MAG: hypothetical protein KBC91_02735 [Candidatus Omnitrophica bacterium]|nr:hypothetical protein [Candidatus Omnitrophota bacterium]